MKDSDKNITQNLDDIQWREFRSNVIGMKQTFLGQKSKVRKSSGSCTIL